MGRGEGPDYTPKMRNSSACRKDLRIFFQDVGGGAGYRPSIRKVGQVQPSGKIDRTVPIDFLWETFTSHEKKHFEPKERTNERSRDPNP